MFFLQPVYRCDDRNDSSAPPATRRWLWLQAELVAFTWALTGLNLGPAPAPPLRWDNSTDFATVWHTDLAPSCRWAEHVLLQALACEWCRWWQSAGRGGADLAVLVGRLEQWLQWYLVLFVQREGPWADAPTSADLPSGAAASGVPQDLLRSVGGKLAKRVTYDDLRGLIGRENDDDDQFRAVQGAWRACLRHEASGLRALFAIAPPRQLEHFAGAATPASVDQRRWAPLLVFAAETNPHDAAILAAAASPLSARCCQQAYGAEPGLVDPSSRLNAREAADTAALFPPDGVPYGAGQRDGVVVALLPRLPEPPTARGTAPSGEGMMQRHGLRKGLRRHLRRNVGAFSRVEQDRMQFRRLLARLFPPMTSAAAPPPGHRPPPETLPLPPSWRLSLIDTVYYCTCSDTERQANGQCVCLRVTSAPYTTLPVTRFLTEYPTSWWEGPRAIWLPPWRDAALTLRAVKDGRAVAVTSTRTSSTETWLLPRDDGTRKQRSKHRRADGWTCRVPLLPDNTEATAFVFVPDTMLWALTLAAPDDIHARWTALLASARHAGIQVTGAPSADTVVWEPEVVRPFLHAVGALAAVRAAGEPPDVVGDACEAVGTKLPATLVLRFEPCHPLCSGAPPFAWVERLRSVAAWSEAVGLASVWHRQWCHDRTALTFWRGRLFPTPAYHVVLTDLPVARGSGAALPLARSLGGLGQRDNTKPSSPRHASWAGPSPGGVVAPGTTMVIMTNIPAMWDRYRGVRQVAQLRPTV